jgi:ferredoxin
MPKKAKELKVNPIKCEAHGLCAELLPELIELDDWGYPIIKEGVVPDNLMKKVQNAVAACPTLALIIQKRDGVNGRSN